METPTQNKLFIAAVTPSLLEKGAGLFSAKQKLEESLRDNPWLARNIFIIERGQKISLSKFLRRIAELGYTKVWETRHRGEFSQRGGIIHVFPINADALFSIEFEGNYIAEITARQTALQGIDQNLVKENSRRGRTPNPDDIIAKHRLGSVGIRNFQTQDFDLRPGDYVVHIDHGIGMFRDTTGDDLIIEYAPPKDRPEAPDRLFVPKKHANRIQPYLGFKKPFIHRLGTSVWEITKKTAKEDIVEFAKKLLETIAHRHTITRTPYAPYPEQEDELGADFAHEDTPDQKKTIKEIFADMAHPYPMDRILTGDVGFGKTEIALRAAFRAILNDKQVAILAPTTILADQHYDTFRARFERFGIQTTRLTRLENEKEIKHIIDRLARGSVDIVIGTHKVLGKHIAFKRLGLLIIDEEQKFGVAHKESLKKTYPEIDILTLSATPIPRTLHLGLSKIQSLSHITTAPQGRTQIQTYVLPKNKKIMKDAIEFELARGGQVYFLANRIHKIPKLLEEIQQLNIVKTNANTLEHLIFSRLNHSRVRVGSDADSKIKCPNVNIAILHGRMNDEDIIRTMHDFRNHKIDILISTTIIENGMDISNANTLIVENATLLGLAEAHQLRGRIGRSDKEAFAYFLYPHHTLGEKAAERLEALERYSWLGAGIEIAKRDLELRGCGNILGRAQSGIAYKVGLNLYFQLLEEAVGELKMKK